MQSITHVISLLEHLIELTHRYHLLLSLVLLGATAGHVEGLAASELMTHRKDVEGFYLSTFPTHILTVLSKMQRYS